MTPADWIALLGIALPLVAKVAVDVAAYLTARKHAALANIVGMAGRQAATAARTLAALPVGTDTRVVEQRLIAAAGVQIGDEMAGSIKTVSATPGAVQTLVQGELDKLVVPLLPAPLPVSPQSPA